MNSNLRIALAALSSLSLGAIACGKSDAPSSQPGSTSVTAASTSDGCATRLASMNDKATDAEKKAYGMACGAISKTARDCIAASKNKAELDLCVTDKADKEKLFAAILGAAMEQSAEKVNGTKLEKAGVTIDVKGEALVSDGLDPSSNFVNAVSFGALNVGVAKKSAPKNLAAAQKEAAMFKPKNVAGETTADGYWLTFENKGSLGTNYWVQLRRTVGGKALECSATVDTKEKADAALAACKSMR